MTEAEFRRILEQLDPLLIVRKIGSTRRDWIASGELYPGESLAGIRRVLRHLSVDFDITQDGGMVWLKIREKPEPALVIPTVNLVLFSATVLTTLLAGSILQGGDPLSNFSDILKGIRYSVALLIILASHEFGHYYYARKHNVQATLPYFIPAPPFFILFGTFGAFIRIKSPIYSRKALLEIGAAGPIAGFVLSVIAIVIGFSLIPDQQAVFEQIRQAHGSMGLEPPPGEGLQLFMGTSLLFSTLASAFDISIPMDEIYHFPLIFAGWIGFLVTMLNLLPIGQLDGGHIAYAILGERHNRFAKWVFLALVPLGFVSIHWWFWAFLILVLMRTVRHPPIMDMHSSISSRDEIIGLSCLIILISCFIPVPIQVF